MAASSGMGLRVRSCDVCDDEVSRYCCPRCTIRTCSLTCVNKHKVEHDCDGVRDKTAYISVKKFTDLDLLNDYRFLEDLGRTVDNASRMPLSKATSYNRYLPYWQQRLVTECNRRQIRLHIMPQAFSRHKKNKTAFYGRRRKIYWFVDWYFPQANVSYSDERIPEDIPLSHALDKYLNPDESTDTIRQHLAFYQSAGYNNVKLLMKVEAARADTPKYNVLDMSKTLCSNLQNKTVIEYPTILVVLKQHILAYELVLSGEESSDEEGETNLDLNEEHINNSALSKNKVEFSDDLPISDLSDDDICVVATVKKNYEANVPVIDVETNVEGLEIAIGDQPSKVAIADKRDKPNVSVVDNVSVSNMEIVLDDEMYTEATNNKGDDAPVNGAETNEEISVITTEDCNSEVTMSDKNDGASVNCIKTKEEVSKMENEDSVVEVELNVESGGVSVNGVVAKIEVSTMATVDGNSEVSTNNESDGVSMNGVVSKDEISEMTNEDDVVETAKDNKDNFLDISVIVPEANASEKATCGELVADNKTDNRGKVGVSELMSKDAAVNGNGEPSV